MGVKLVLPKEHSLKWRVIQVEGLRPTDKGVFNRLLETEDGSYGIYAMDLYSFLVENNVAKQLDEEDTVQITLPSEKLVKLKRLTRRKAIKLKVRALR